MDDFLSETKTTAGGFTGSKCGTYHEHETNAFHWHDRPVLQPWDVGKSNPHFTCLLYMSKMKNMWLLPLSEIAIFFLENAISFH
jgi:hypothetical protein